VGACAHCRTCKVKCNFDELKGACQSCILHGLVSTCTPALPSKKASDTQGLSTIKSSTSHTEPQLAKRGRSLDQSLPPNTQKHRHSESTQSEQSHIHKHSDLKAPIPSKHSLTVQSSSCSSGSTLVAVSELNEYDSAEELYLTNLQEFDFEKQYEDLKKAKEMASPMAGDIEEDQDQESKWDKYKCESDEVIDLEDIDKDDDNDPGPGHPPIQKPMQSSMKKSAKNAKQPTQLKVSLAPPSLSKKPVYDPETCSMLSVLFDL
jgi:hypothetical protein